MDFNSQARASTTASRCFELRCFDYSLRATSPALNSTSRQKVFLITQSVIMSSHRPARSTQQDIIAKVRYSNQLPPPPNPPKLLDIPGTGLAGGQYTSAGYASRLAREQPLNIEADAELGMPIDLVGIPGVFDGDDKGIYCGIEG